jgi:hypothetical protein
MQGGPVIHWMNGGGADCGAPTGAFVSPYPHAVTCKQCLVAMKLDVLRRRLAVHRLAVRHERRRRAFRADSSGPRKSPVPRKSPGPSKSPVPR